MGLNLNAGGDFIPHIRYMASTSSWSMSTENGQQHFNMTEVIFDLENIKTGWGKFEAGMAPAWVMDSSLTAMAPRPEGQDWKRGFNVTVFSKSIFGDDGVRELATTSTGAVKGIEALYAQYEREAPANAGKVPVVAFQGSVPLKVGKGNTTVPTLVITKWVDRPAELSGNTQPVQQPVQPPQQPAPQGISEF